MQSCEQTQGMSIYQHGVSVNDYFHDLYNHIIHKTPLKFEWKLPDWVYESVLWNNLLELSIIDEYQIYHDCGKPFCLIIDSDGKKHFPEHAQISSKIWLEYNGHSERNIQISKLIEMDMEIHLLKDIGVEDFCKHKEAATLLITGLCEVHSNASMFGGIESISFKTKFKHINKRGKKITNYLMEKTQ